jgi:hypothetical protein
MTTEHQREQQERRETLDNDQRLREQQKQAEASSYLDQYHSDVGGRFKVEEHETITGRVSPKPPPLPASSPWAELDNPIVRGQLALDRAWQARLDARFNRPDAISEYDPVKRLDSEFGLSTRVGRPPLHARPLTSSLIIHPAATAGGRELTPMRNGKKKDNCASLSPFHYSVLPFSEIPNDPRPPSPETEEMALQ